MVEFVVTVVKAINVYVPQDGQATCVSMVSTFFSLNYENNLFDQLSSYFWSYKCKFSLKNRSVLFFLRNKALRCNIFWPGF